MNVYQLKVKLFTFLAKASSVENYFMSRSDIPLKVKYQLWAASGGRCEYDGCNKSLWGDPLTKAKFSTAYIAHIIAEKPDGPRGDPELSPKLAHEFSNLMLLCDVCHRRIDKHDEKGHPPELLRAMKGKHEERIALQTSLGPDKKSHVLLYGANFGKLKAVLSFEKAYHAMYPYRFPATDKPIDIGLKNSTFTDDESLYWQIEQTHLQRRFQTMVESSLDDGEIQHLSVFAIAPQPLLIELGRLLSDAMPIDVYQHQKEPVDSWKWSNDEESDDISFQIIPPSKQGAHLALNLSLSATITNERIESILGEDTAIWTITIDNPNRDFLKAPKQLRAFRNAFFSLLDTIKATHGQGKTLHVFPACPVSIAIEIGRVWYPKADLPMRIYDQNIDGFSFALEIK